MQCVSACGLLERDERIPAWENRRNTSVSTRQVSIEHDLEGVRSDTYKKKGIHTCEEQLYRREPAPLLELRCAMRPEACSTRSLVACTRWPQSREALYGHYWREPYLLDE